MTRNVKFPIFNNKDKPIKSGFNRIVQVVIEDTSKYECYIFEGVFQVLVLVSRPLWKLIHGS